MPPSMSPRGRASCRRPATRERLPEAVGHRRRRPPANSDSVRTVSEVVGEARRRTAAAWERQNLRPRRPPSSKSRAWSRSGPLPSGEGGTAVSLAVPPLFFPSLGIAFGYCWMSVSTPTMLIRPLDTVRVSPPVAQLTLIVTTEDGPPVAVYTPSSAMPPFATFVLSPKRSVSRRSISVVTPFSTATSTHVTCIWPLAKGALSLASTMYELVPEVT